MPDLLLYAAEVAHHTSQYWAWSGVILLFDKPVIRAYLGWRFPGWFLACARWVYHELRPFYLPLVTFAVIVLAARDPDPTAAALQVTLSLLIWRWLKDVDDDDRWRRRRKRLTEKVAVLGGRLQVVPSH